MLKLTADSKVLIVTMTVSLTTLTAIGIVGVAEAQQSQPQEPRKLAQIQATIDSSAGIDNEISDEGFDQETTATPIQRGRGKDRAMLLRGRVLDADGRPAHDFELGLNVKGRFGRGAKTVDINKDRFEVWVPIGGNDWFYLELWAHSKDGRQRIMQGISNRELRQFAVEGIDLLLRNADRAVAVTITKSGKPVAGAHVVAETQDSVPLRTKTDSSGQAAFALSRDDKLGQLTAWTDDHLIGGYSFSRKPRRDPLGHEFEIELNDCRDQTVRFLHVEDDSPVPGVAFTLTIGTGPPNYNFPAVPYSFPYAHMKTDANGEAVCPWFPDWEKHGAYVEIVDSYWAKALEDLETDEDGALVMKLKPRAHRKPLVGQVISKTHDVSGLLLQIRSFQGEEKQSSDHLYAFTDPNGNFTADCIPGSTYCVCVNDARLVSNIIDLIPYEADTGKSNRATLTVSEGRPVQIRVTTGANRRPMANTWVHLRAIHDYTWYEDGERQHGSGGRMWGTSTDENGITLERALAGDKLEISVNAGEWRSEDREVTVEADELTRVEFHREFDVKRSAKGRLLAPPDMLLDLAGAEIYYGSIDGETDEKEVIKTDSDGHFAFETRAIQLGILAFTADGRAAGVLKPESLDQPLELKLTPTADLHGRLLGDGDQLLANHTVWVKPTVRGKKDFSKSFFTGFSTKLFETNTDSQGNYTIKRLPTGLDMRLQADPIDGSDNDAYLDSFFLKAGETRPRMISRLGRSRPVDDRSLEEEYADVLRDAKLNDFHLLVMIFDSTSDDFAGRYLMDRERTNEAMSFMNLRIREKDVIDDVARGFVASHDWPLPTHGEVFVCALDGSGNELGRATLDTQVDGVKMAAAEFLKTHAPPQRDAQAKWDAAFAEANRSGRKVWARIGQRYCGPCFRLSRWLDDNREQLERDYVLLKVDDVRDKHGAEIANRIVSNRDHFGIPFHTIFDLGGNLLIDSEGPTGNIGHPSSFEGRRHLRRMLIETKTSLTDFQIDEIVSTLGM